MIDKLNIQINNLCMILPQDRVQDFTKMNKKQLLEHTQKSVGWYNKFFHLCLHNYHLNKSKAILYSFIYRL